jgi:hypothetical protein
MHQPIIKEPTKMTTKYELKWTPRGDAKGYKIRVSKPSIHGGVLHEVKETTSNTITFDLEANLDFTFLVLADCYDGKTREIEYGMKVIHVADLLPKRDNPVRVVVSDPVTGVVLNDTVVTHGEEIHIAEIPLNRVKAIEEAALAVERWWVREGMNRFDGAPACVFALRRALSMPKDIGISKTCGGGRDWTGVGQANPISKEM